ncbi:DUF3634 family protein [Vibrio sp. JC009]|uniref:DUF3634 family protein n=1 Tax=Vibrio sp. JC009 TaxID=2912314 RepID=UPI0023B0BCF2|nr:DUF3634 family protein [Vibrio sp. JC009]WED23175.1 DUF3634 family protein [Vibrio sp. JC009]
MMYVILIGAAVVCWLVFIDRPVLKMTFKEGDLVKHQGRLPSGFAHNCKEIGHRTPFDGIVKVYMTRSGAKLNFSKDVPGKIQQRIRNVFPHQGFKTTKGKKA